MRNVGKFLVVAMFSVSMVHADDAALKAQAADAVEKKAEEIGALTELIKNLEKDIPETREALKKANFRKARSNVTLGVPAVGLLAVTVITTRLAFFKNNGPKDYGWMMGQAAKAIFGIVATASAVGTGATGYIIYLRRADATRLNIKLNELERQIEPAKITLELKRTELKALKEKLAK